MSMKVEEVNVVILPDGRMDTANSAKYVGLSPKTMAMMRCSGVGPEFIKRGKVFYFKRDLDIWIAEGNRKTTLSAV